MAAAGDPAPQALLRRGLALEYATLSWNVAGIVVLTIAALTARSVVLATGYHPRHSLPGIAWTAPSRSCWG